MSRINVENIRHPDASSDSLQLSDTGNITAPGNLSVTGTSTLTGDTTVTGSLTANGVAYPSAGPLSNRNLILNGAMAVSQRSTSETGVSSGGYQSLDRMRYSESSLGTAEITHEQSTDAPDGFSHSLKITVTTAEGSVNAADGFRPIEYRIEGQDLQHLAYGTSSAKSLTLSFYVKSSATGTYGICFYRNESTARQITDTYTINSANTWEYKTITIPGDTSASITNDNTNRFAVYFHAGAGSDWTSTDSSGSWGNYAAGGFAYGNEVNLQNTENATWQATGIQLEVGSVATPFEHRSYGDELDRCERYFQTYGPFFGIVFHNYTTALAYGGFALRKPMRDNPTAYHLEAYNSSHLSFYSAGGAAKTLTSFTLNSARPHFVQFQVGGTLGTAGHAAHLDCNQTDAIQLEAEL